MDKLSVHVASNRVRQQMPSVKAVKTERRKNARSTDAERFAAKQ